MAQSPNCVSLPTYWRSPTSPWLTSRPTRLGQPGQLHGYRATSTGLHLTTIFLNYSIIRIIQHLGTPEPWLKPSDHLTTTTSGRSGNNMARRTPFHQRDFWFWTMCLRQPLATAWAKIMLTPSTTYPTVRCSHQKSSSSKDIRCFSIILVSLVIHYYFVRYYATHVSTSIVSRSH